MTAAIIVGALALAAIAYIVAPIGRSGSALDDPMDESAAEEKKRVALTGILDLEEERDGGKLSESEYVDLRARYERDAVEALKELDTASSESTLEDHLEKEIAAARDKLRCGTCGAPRDVDAIRCSSCGSSY